MKKIFLTLTIFIYSTLLFCGSINGFIVDHEENPLMGANIMIMNTDLGNTTNEDGFFNIDDLTPGKYNLSINYIPIKIILLFLIFYNFMMSNCKPLVFWKMRKVFKPYHCLMNWINPIYPFYVSIYS